MLSGASQAVLFLDFDRNSFLRLGMKLPAHVSWPENKASSALVFEA